MGDGPDDDDVSIRIRGAGLFADNIIGQRQAVARCTNRERLLGYELLFLGAGQPESGTGGYIIYQVEQYDSPQAGSADCHAKLAGAAAVWDFSAQNCARWVADGLVPGWCQVHLTVYFLGS